MHANTHSFDAVNNWARALASAPHVLEGAAVDDPERLRRLADSAASLHGLVHYVLENCASDDWDVAELEWDYELLVDASTRLYRNLGLSDTESVERMQRLSGGMMGTARHMAIDPMTTWRSVRDVASRADVAQ
ncbi:MAG: hypothetical protein QNJ00_10150 [Woeseiaceae bacterium]|nr:hypothetical protein [Woeseiaceae bacterium]